MLTSPKLGLNAISMLVSDVSMLRPNLEKNRLFDSIQMHIFNDAE